MSNENGPVQSVAKALRLLDLLMEAHQPLTLAALSEQTGWPKSTIHGLLSTMRESAVLDQQSDGRYCLGVRLFEYGCAVGARTVCDVSCIACGLCVKNCPADAIHIEQFHAVIDTACCLSCGACAVVCPRHVIKDRFGVLTPVH